MEKLLIYFSFFSSSALNSTNYLIFQISDSKMLMKIVSILFVIKIVSSQVPGFGRCPEYQPMANFDKEKFLGRWIEIERYFTVSEVISKCISADYERRADGNIYVKNYYTNRL